MSPQKTSKELAQVVARAIIDPEFRQALIKDPKKTLYLAEFSLTESEMKKLSELKMEDWEKLTLKELDLRLKKEKLVPPIRRWIEP